MNEVIPHERIEKRIHELRGKKVMLDRDLAAMVSQNVIASRKATGGYFPIVFTEQGVAMLSSVLNSSRAVQVNIQIMRTFSKMREMMQ